ncbi:MAG: UDP-3-O-acyl-N-acetylglucosamine deacetylase [Telmatospirillum sp.]|nr:UDP-3-O-acyl-N-acetylglucosamine deacetylase [Telmatospirillum sp.]
MFSDLAPSVIRQRTLKSAISCTGVGLHSGCKMTMTLRPAAANTGILFRRIDIAGDGSVIPALWSNVSDTRLNTSVSGAKGASVHTIEHLMAALAGMGIDNAIIDINGPEVPVMDGSAAPFLFLIECAGIVEQQAPRQAIKILKRVVTKDGDKRAMLTPGRSFSLRVEIDFPMDAIGRQECFLPMNSAAFKAEVSRARTFGFEQEVAAMHAAGLGKGGSLDNAVVIASGGEKVLNEGGLRYVDEFVRHKTLDAVGDLALAGAPILGHFHGVRCGHALNNRLLRDLFSDRTAWTMVELGNQQTTAPAMFSAPQRLAVAASA